MVSDMVASAAGLSSRLGLVGRAGSGPSGLVTCASRPGLGLGLAGTCPEPATCPGPTSPSPGPPSPGPTSPSPGPPSPGPTSPSPGPAPTWPSATTPGPPMGQVAELGQVAGLGSHGCQNLQRIGESRQRPLEICSYEGHEALPPIGKENQQRYKLVNDRLRKDRQRLHRAAEYRRGIDGRARNNAQGQGGWGADAVQWASCKAVRQRRGADQLQSMVVSVIERRTRRVSSAVTGLQRMMRTGFIPAAWKVARISPLFKDTDPTDPNKYRMLAVSSVLYRLYANVLRHVLTAWCMTHKVLPAEQFGFIPGRSTMQPMFILRHLVHAQKASADAKHRKLFTAFIDFKQAYDHIPRQQLWEHLRVGIKLPQPLLACLEGLYRDDSYVLIDGPHRTPPVTPDQGVKQGCPISPLLFALYVHDISKEFLGPVDAVRVQGTPVTHFMYADDLTLVSTSPHGLQRLVCQLQGFADRKHLTVNVGKSKVMVFNGNSQTAAPCIGYKHEILPVVREFKYLGMHFNPSATPAFAATHMRAGMFLAMRQACNRAREYGVLHDPFALCHLIRAFVLPLGLYGSQVWGTAFLGHGVQLSNPVQTRMLSFLRFAARVRSSVSGLMVLHELGQLPLQLYWFRAACKFWNTAKLSHSDLLMRVIKADVELGRSCQASWSAQFQLAARELMGDEFTLSPDMVLGTKAMEVKWLERWGRRWVGFEGDPRLPETVHRERCSYAAWFKHGDGIGINHMAPHLLNRQLSTEVRTSLTRFRLGNSGLGVEKARFEGVTFIDRTCTRCTEGVVDDAMHFIFECTATSSIREQPEFAMTLQNNNENLHDFMLSPCAPLFVHLALKCVTESPEPLEGEGGLAA
ncbi:hypothetical protein QJQ45_013315 [Haematococcus lacustris]|nr:hypothetical protein QJQ45_013315 [Haematococcus lacustris]